MTFGDIILIPFPFTDLSAIKVRPAAILAEVPVGRESDLITVCITTNTNNLKSHDVLLDASDTEFPQTGLKARSAIRAHKIVTLQKSSAIRRLGRLGKGHVAKLKANLQRLLSLQAK